MTVFFTIFSGVCVFVIGQIVMKFVIDPFHAQRETIGKVVDFLILYANVFTNPGIPIQAGIPDEEWEDARRAQLNETKHIARALASEIMVRTQAVPLYGLLERLGWAVKRSNIRSAQKSLFFISNALFDQGNALDNYEQARQIEEALGVVTEFRIEEEQPQAAEDNDDGQ